MTWNNHCFQLLNWSKQWMDSQHPDLNLEEEWDLVVTKSQFLWEKVTGFKNVIAEDFPEDEVEGDDGLSQTEDVGMQVNEDEIYEII